MRCVDPKFPNNVELRFENYCDVDEGVSDHPLIDVVICASGSAQQIMAWYGAYFAGDHYKVFKDGTEIQIDQNGEKVSEIIEGEVA